MKWFLFLLAIGFVASDKLDRTYLPPAGAKFAGGSPGDIQTPLELPKLSGPGTTFSENGFPTPNEIEIGINRGQDGPTRTQYTYYPENLPTTTTSYAFSQTTTLPPFETYKVTGAPINPVTGEIVRLPGQNTGSIIFEQTSGNAGSPITQGSVVTSGENSPGYKNNQQVQYDRPTNIRTDTPYQGQYKNNIIDNIQTPQLINQEGIINSEQPQFVSRPSPDRYPQDANIQPGSSGSFDEVKTTFEQNSLPEQNQFEQRQYGQPSNGQQIFAQPSPQKEDFGQISDTFQPGPSTTFSSANYQNQIGISSTTPMPSSFASTLYPSTVVYKIRPERPQAENDRNAVILNFENNRTPNGYSYSYDTSNGIHADETGIVDNGTKARGGYSYIGDDGKTYSITYTADENGFQPRGDHLPTPPPIPEAIQKVIEQAAKDREAGIFDDGSYDETKYGDMGSKSRTQPNYKNSNINDSQNNRGYSNENNGMVPSNFAINESPVKNVGIAKTTPDSIMPLRNLNIQINPEDNGSPKRILPGVTPTTDGYSTPQEGSYAITKSGSRNYPSVDVSLLGSNGSDNSRITNRPGEVTYTTTINEEQSRFPDDTSTVLDNKVVDYPKLIEQYGATGKPGISQDFGYVDFDGTSNQYLPPKNLIESNRIPSTIELRMGTSPKPQLNGNPDSTAKPFITPNVKNNIYNNPLESYVTNNPGTGGDIRTIPGSVFINQEYTEVPAQAPDSQTLRSYEITRNTPKYYKYTPNGQEVIVTQKGTPSSRRPNYFVQSTTPIPKQTTRFGPIQSAQNNRLVSTTMMPEISINSESSTFRQPGGKFGSTGPASNVRNVELTPGSSPSDFTFGARLPTTNIQSTTPIKTTSTYRPSSDFGITGRPEDRNTGLVAQSGSSTPTSEVTYETGYQYGPGISPLGYTSRPITLKPGSAKAISSGPGMYSQVRPGSTYQSGYQYGPVPDLKRPTGILNTGSTIKPTTGQESPGNYQDNFGPVSSTTATPGKFILSSTPGSNTGFSTTRNPNDSVRLVDNFGRPINDDNSFASNPERPSNGNDRIRKPDGSYDKSDENGPLNDSTIRNYPTTERINGEDFSGPKRPQTFDPETGYYY